MQYSLIGSSIFILFSLHLLFLAFAEQCHPNDKKVLLQIKSHFHAKGEFAFTDWDSNTDCCYWFGVDCDANSRVTSLSLLLTSGTPNTIPSVVGYLPFLEYLKLDQFGSLFGPIPKTIGLLTNLKKLDITYNNITGPIPTALGRLTKLSSLYLHMNSLSGPIPSTLGRLANLTNLDLGYNRLTGPIPSTIGKLTSLVYLDLSYNRLFGRITPSLAYLTKVKTLELSSNRLTGSVPSSFGSFKNPHMLLFLSHNRLSGPIPRSVGKINILLINLSYNKLTGDASFLFGRDKTALEFINLSNNKFSFDFSKVEFPIRMRAIDIMDNHIYGSLPKQLGQLPLEQLGVSNNWLCGPIPTGRRLKQLSPVYFAHNKCLCGLPLPPCK